MLTWSRWCAHLDDLATSRPTLYKKWVGSEILFTTNLFSKSKSSFEKKINTLVRFLQNTFWCHNCQNCSKFYEGRHNDKIKFNIALLWLTYELFLIFLSIPKRHEYYWGQIFHKEYCHPFPSMEKISPILNIRTQLFVS